MEDLVDIIFKTRQRLRILLKSPGTITLVVCLILLAINIVMIGRLRPFNSDDLYWQQVVRTWVPFSGKTLYLATKDTFVELVPFFALLEHVFNPSRKLLIAETGILTMASFGFFYASSLYFLRKMNTKLTYIILLPFVWLSSFGYPLVQNYLNSDWRTFEVGLSFLTFTFAAAICMGDFRPLSSAWSKIISILAVIYIGVIIFSDPYYVYFTLGPIVLLVGLLYSLKKIKRLELAIIYGGVVLSLMFAQVTNFILGKAGVVIVTDTPSIFVGFDSIVTNIVASLHGLLIVFGADFFGQPIASLAVVGSVINAAILGIILYRVHALRTVLQQQNINKLSLPQLWMIFFGLLIPFIFTVYCVSSLVAVANYRFFIVLIYSAVVFLALTLAVSKNSTLKLVTACLLVAATIFNIFYTSLTNTIRAQPDVANNIGNSLNFDIIHTVETEGLEKGYGNYWQGNVNTYLSNGKIAFLPVVCFNSTTAPFKWLIDGAMYERVAHKTFYIMDPDRLDPPTCGLEKLTAQFGEPEKTLMISNKTILIYNYDIVTKMGKDWQPGK